MSYEVLKAVAQRPGSALVTVVAVRGSVPRHVGSKMAVLPDGSIVGTVGGGVLESRAIDRAKACIAAAASDGLEVELTGAEALGATPVCGGVAELWIEYVGDPSPFREAVLRLDAGQTVVLASLRAGSGGGPGCAAVLDAQGALVGGRPGCADGHEAAKAASAGTAALSDAADLFYDPVLPPERLLVLGGGHVGLAVARFARSLDFKVTIADDRPEFADPDRFPEGVETLNGGYVDIIERFPFGPSAYALIVTPGHLSDMDCVRAALKREYRYLGLIGSKRKVRMVMEQMIAEGYDRDRVEALYSPVGVDIGAETPEEIAVSILAEMIAVRRRSPALAAMEADRRRRRG